jgi:hypothetical protein
LYSEEPAWTLKIKHQRLLEEHKRGYLKLIQKDVSVIPSAFTFTTWNQMVLDCENFQSYLAKSRESYSKDPVFQEYVREDIESSNRSLTEVTLGYLLEEVLLDYLVAHGLVNLPNEYVRNHEKWILNCYHGKPHRSHVYFHQKNPFGIKSTNTFRNSWYDLKKKKLYDFDRLNIETFDFSR